MQALLINRPPRDGHMAFIRSPDNISIELLQRGKFLVIRLPPLECVEIIQSTKNIGLCNLFTCIE